MAAKAAFNLLSCVYAYEKIACAGVCACFVPIGMFAGNVPSGIECVNLLFIYLRQTMTGGRQREFDKQEALESAMRVFWKKGFAGASLTELTESMGINKPSLYSAFGNKEQLFIKATEHYMKTIATPHDQCLYGNQPLKVRLKNYMLSVVRAQCAPGRPKGCFVSLCITESEGDIFPPAAAKHVAKLKEFTERYLIDFFKAEVKLGNILPTEDAATRARFITAVLNGTAVMARGGRSIDELEPVIDTSLSLFTA